MGHRHIYSLTYCLWWLLAAKAEYSSCGRDLLVWFHLLLLHTAAHHYESHWQLELDSVSSTLSITVSVISYFLLPMYTHHVKTRKVDFKCHSSKAEQNVDYFDQTRWKSIVFIIQ